MRGRSAIAGTAGRRLRWPDDPEGVTAGDVDFTALAHVLANTCRRGGRMRHYHSLAAHAVFVSAEVGALEGLCDEDRRRLALHALLAGAASAWLRSTRLQGTWVRGTWLRGEWAGPAREAGRTARLAARIEAAMREAAGLDAVLDEEHARLLRLVARMADAAERRDLDGPDESFAAGAGIAFPPSRRRIRAIPPDRAAHLWLARLHELTQPPRQTGGAAAAGNPTPIPATTPIPGPTPIPGNEEETGDVAYIPKKDTAAAARAGETDEPQAA